MTVLIVMLSLVVIVLIVVGGVYLILKMQDEGWVKLTEAEHKLATALIDNNNLRDEVRMLKVDLATEKNRKIHDAD